MPKIKDKKVTILKFREFEDEHGFTTGVYEPLPGAENIWAYFRHASGNEFIQTENTNSKIDVIFEINWRNGVDTSMQIQYKGQKYNITCIDNYEGYKKDLKIYAYKLNQGGE